MSGLNETLVIVHLSSLEGYVRFYGIKSTQVLCDDLCSAILTHDGPVVIMDQGMEHADSLLASLDQHSKEILADAKAFHDRVLACKHRNLTVFHHDELMDVSPWQDGMGRLAKVLRKLNPASNRIRLGGMWTSQDGRTGCVHETAFQLRVRRFRCRIDPSICALEELDTREERYVRVR